MNLQETQMFKDLLEGLYGSNKRAVFVGICCGMVILKDNKEIGRKLRQLVKDYEMLK